MTKTKYITRPFQKSDFEKAAVIFAASFAGEPWNEKWTAELAAKKLKDYYNTPRFMGLVVQEPKTRNLVAMAMGAFELFQDERFYFLKEICVHPDFQRQGIAKDLMKTLIEAVKKDGTTYFMLMTNRKGGAERLYSKLGFKDLNHVKIMGLGL